MIFVFQLSREESGPNKRFLVNCGLSWLHGSQFFLKENNKINAEENKKTIRVININFR